MTNEVTAKPVSMIVDKDCLRRAEMALNGVKIYHPDSPEVARITAACQDIISRLSADDLSQYSESKNVIETPEQIAARNEAERIAMESNRDSQSI